MISMKHLSSTSRLVLCLCVLAFILLILDYLCNMFALPVYIDIRGTQVLLRVGSQSLVINNVGHVAGFQIAPRDPVIHEYQIDGSDSTNNFTLDINYLHSIANTPLYRLYAWMRDLDSLSHWKDMSIQSASSKYYAAQPAQGVLWTIDPHTPTHISLQWQRPETPTTLELTTTDNATIAITLDRNDRYILVTREQPTEAPQTLTRAFFPVDPLPFGTMVLDTLIKTTLWAELILACLLVLQTVLALCLARIVYPVSRISNYLLHRMVVPLRHITASLHPMALGALVLSGIFVAWIARVQYSGLPHIYDAVAYLFAAKMYAHGQLFVPLPLAITHFPGPFMVAFDGRWFAQYPPGTALTLVPGIWLGIPWLVEPVMGTLALLGSGLIAARLYNRQIATLTVLLGALSPFYSYLAASYLSHAIALFYLVWGTWSLLRFMQGEASWNLPLAAFLFGMAALTREQVGLLFIVAIIAGLTWIYGKRLRRPRSTLLYPVMSTLGIGLLFLLISLGFNAWLTHDLFTAPRTLFFAGDRWGFGSGVGFYGEHTLAAGLVNLDEQMTSLAIVLFGWPFYCTLAFLVIPFLTGKAQCADYMCLGIFLLIAGAYVGYFYHGIYFGPRYLFETLPFLLMLTARGFITLSETTRQGSDMLLAHFSWDHKRTSQLPISLSTLLLLACLVGYSLGYFLPCQVSLYSNYNGLPSGTHLDLAAMYHPPSKMKNALVVINDYTIYQLVCFPLNDPLLHDSVIYAYANDPQGYNELHQAFPGRVLYQLNIASNGAVSYQPWTP